MRAWVGVNGRSSVPPQTAVQHNANTFAVTAMVQQAMQYVDQTPDLETKKELIKTLDSVATGKIYVEIERARLIKKLAIERKNKVL
ncbi:26S proteasome non-ATPase regulatory subunit 12 homolog A-like [Syzygium oleosum]|uniref:26S proteasome non-ATPase regulatory subunit 12 homolog A-like n=1 Tax=Syzygium oleosum TaxID=219896 RepID=UPI0024B957F5|nr:26S proteasome non-ATPase regulatory subunit 12 homolog A-like [Syzygium oleosum]